MFTITFRIPDPGCNTDISHPSNYKMNVLLVENLMKSLNGEFIGISYGSETRYSYELHQYKVPVITEAFVKDVVIDLGSNSRLTIDYPFTEIAENQYIDE